MCADDCNRNVRVTEGPGCTSAGVSGLVCKVRVHVCVCEREKGGERGAEPSAPDIFLVRGGDPGGEKLFTFSLG